MKVIKPTFSPAASAAAIRQSESNLAVVEVSPKGFTAGDSL
jgi:hypothetical protein